MNVNLFEYRNNAKAYTTVFIQLGDFLAYTTIFIQ